MDILFEVFMRLQPLDVLNIMYTSKGFRDLLIVPSSTFIWKAARLNIEGFPDCPPFLSEVEYAKLAFYPYCYRCGKRTPNGPQWEVLARFCGACLKDVLTDMDNWYSNRYLNASSYKVILGVIERNQSSRRRSSYFYCKPQVSRLLKHMRNLPETSSETWLADAKRNAPGISEHAKLCRQWEDDFRESRREQLWNTKLKRRHDIYEKLSQLGFGPALSQGNVGSDFADHRLVKSGVALTERIWNNIKPVLVGWLQELETTRLVLPALAAFKKSHPDVLLPGIADLLTSNKVKRVLGNLGDVPVSEESFGDLAVFVDDWRRTATLQLAGLVVNPTEERVELHDRAADKGTFAKLHLATTVFSCSCQRFVPHDATLDKARQVYMHYPWVMSHPCVTNEWSDSDDELWNAENLRYEGEAGNTVIKPIIEACGLPAEMTKTSDMDTLDPRLICLKCKRDDAKPAENIVVYTWRSAIGHALICHHKEAGYSWHQLPNEATEMAKSAESTIRGTKVVGDAAREAEIDQWGCTQCRDHKYRSSPTSIRFVKWHSTNE
ncbi:hypothetical protein BD410DRAFT_745304, partial [Rickenella mellea]